MPRDIRLVQISDPHLFANPDGELRGTRTLESLERVLQRALSDSRGVDAVLCSGDIVNDEAAGYRHFVRLLKDRGLPVYCVPGNHDDPERLRDVLGRAPFQTGGCADLGEHWRLVLLDSSVPGRTAGHLDARQLAALEQALDTQRCVAVCLHHQPIALASRWLDEVGLDNGEELLARLHARPQVRVLAFGHVHQNFETCRRGLMLLGTPSTCGQFAPQARDFTLDERPPAYRHLTLRADGSVDTEVTWLWNGAQLHAGRPTQVGLASAG